MRGDDTARHTRSPMDTHELAWAAGFFDGEGCTAISRYKPKNQKAIRTVIIIGVSQAHREPLDRFKEAVSGVGVINGPYQVKGSVKPKWVYKVSGFERCQAVIAMLWRWLGTVKREQAVVALRTAHGEARPVGHPTQEYCKRGHDLGMWGRVRPNGERRCRECERLRSLAAFYRRKGDQEEAKRVLDGTHASRKRWRREDRPV